MKINRSRQTWSLLSLCLFLFLAACGGGQSTTGSTASTGTTADAASETSSGPVKIVWWHSMSGDLNKVVDELVKKFNDSQKDVQVEAIFQGDYDASINKFKTSMGSGSGPTMIQTYDVGTRYMIDSQAITPMQQFIDADKFDTTQFEPNILKYYTFDNQLYSMPFNTSNPIFYYNKDAFKKAGLDPENPPKTLDEWEAAAKALTTDGQTGMSLPIYGWLMEQMFASQDATLLNNDNGRTALATESQLGSEPGVKFLTWWKKLIDEKYMLNLGRKTDDTKKAFAAGQVAVTMDSTASLRGLISSTEGKFEVGTAPLPKVSSSDMGKGGVVIGGASLWIMNDKPAAEQQAAWKFIKFLAEPEQQAYWHVNTGYFPITKAAYNEDLVKENMKKYPQFETAVDQLHNTKIDPATQGAVMGIFTEARQLTETAIEEALNGSKQPQAALSDAAAQITQKLKDYNDSVNP